jgi:hypothetical protein
MRRSATRASRGMAPWAKAHGYPRPVAPRRILCGSKDLGKNKSFSSGWMVQNKLESRRDERNLLPSLTGLATWNERFSQP